MPPAATVVQKGEDPKRWGFRRWHPAAAVLGGVALLLGIGGYLRYQAAAPEPPAVVLQEVDPAVAAFVGEAYRAVQQSPRSAASLGRLGMVPLAHDFLYAAKHCLSPPECLDR